MSRRCIYLCLLIFVTYLPFNSASSIELLCPNAQIVNIHEPFWSYTYPDEVEGNRCMRISPHASNNRQPDHILIEITDFQFNPGANLSIYEGFFPSSNALALVVDTTGTEISVVVNSSIYFLYYYTNGAPGSFTIKHLVNIDGMKLGF